jgi:hypothetical protein
MADMKLTGQKTIAADGDEDVVFNAPSRDEATEDAVSAAGRVLDPFTGTEALLNRLIAECYVAMRDVAVPLSAKTADVTARRFFLSDITELAKAGAVVGRTVAMLRAASIAAEGGILEQSGKILPAIAKNG